MNELKQWWSEAPWWQRILAVVFLPLVLFVVVFALRQGHIPSSADAEVEAAQNNAAIEHTAQQQAATTHQQAAQQTATIEHTAQKREGQIKGEADKLRQEAQDAQSSEQMRDVLNKLVRRK